MKERRKQERQGTRRFLRAFDRKTQRLVGELVNLSFDGAMLITPGAIKPAESFECRVELPFQILNHNEVCFKAECRWSRKNVQAGRWETGLLISTDRLNGEIVNYLIMTLKLEVWGDTGIEDVNTVELENRRWQPRYVLDEMLPVYEPDSHRQIGRLADLSTGGVRLITKRSIEKGDLIKCRVLLRDAIHEQQYLIFEARCVWGRTLDDGDQYESGYMIEKISKQDAAILLHLLIHQASIQPTTKRIKVLK